MKKDKKKYRTIYFKGGTLDEVEKKYKENDKSFSGTVTDLIDRGLKGDKISDGNWSKK